MSYKILLFDLDDTLLDFSANEIDSLNKLFRLHGYTFSDELFQLYNSVNKKLWADYENGNIALDDVLNSRFSQTMLKLGRLWMASSGKISIGALGMDVSLWRVL